MNSMVTGDTMSISRKGLSVLMTWRAHVLMASNYNPDYVNVGNSLTRKFAIFKIAIFNPNGHNRNIKGFIDSP